MKQQMKRTLCAILAVLMLLPGLLPAGLAEGISGGLSVMATGATLTHRVQFVNTATGEHLGSVEVENGGTLGSNVPSYTTPANMSFSKWTTSLDGSGTGYSSSAIKTVKITGPTTFYAQFSADSATRTAIFYVNLDGEWISIMSASVTAPFMSSSYTNLDDVPSSYAGITLKNKKSTDFYSATSVAGLDNTRTAVSYKSSTYSLASSLDLFSTAYIRPQSAASAYYYTVGFQIEYGGNTEAYTSRIVASGTKYSAIPNVPSLTSLPEISGYEKPTVGWKSGNTAITNGTAAVSAQGVTFTVSYTKKPEVTFDDGQGNTFTRAGGSSGIENFPAPPTPPAGQGFIDWFIQGTDTRVTAATVVSGDIRVVARYGTLRTLTYLDDDDTPLYTLSGIQGLPLTLPADPAARPGLVFAGWYLGDTRVNQNTLVTGDLTLRARYNKEMYFATFRAQGRVVDIVTVSYQEVVPPAFVPQPTLPEDKRFLGWSLKEGNASGIVDLTTYLFTGPTTLYAILGEKVYQAEFRGAKTYREEPGAQVTAVDLPANKKYVPLGWISYESAPISYFLYETWGFMLDLEVGDQYTIPNKDSVFYPLYRERNASFHDVSGTLYGSFDGWHISAPAGAELTLPTGYDFLGWATGTTPVHLRFDQELGTLKLVEGFEDESNYCAVYRQKTVTVTFMDGNRQVAQRPYGYGEPLGTPDIEGYRLGTAKEEEDQSLTFVGWQPQAVALTQDLTVQAVWDEITLGENQFMVVFVDEEGIPYSTKDDPRYRQIVNAGSSAEAPLEPEVPADYISFQGWYEDNADAEYAFSSPVTKNMVLGAKYKKTYLASYVVDGVVVDHADLSKTDVIVRPAEDPRSVEANTEFKGWYLENGDGSQVPFAGWGQRVDSDVRLVAQFNHLYYIYYDSQGGSPVLPAQYMEGTESYPAAPDADPTRVGYLFLGWSLTPGGAVLPRADFLARFGKALDSSLTLYAVWDPQPVQVQIVLWQQRAKGDRQRSAQQYNYKTQVVGWALAGSRITYENGTLKGLYTDQGLTKAYSKPGDDTGDFLYYQYANFSAPQEVLGSGTVVNLYYDRVVYALKFNPRASGTSAADYMTMTYNGVTYTGKNNDYYILYAEYEEQIGDRWPYNGSPNFTFGTNGTSVLYGWTNYSSSTQVSKILVMGDVGCAAAKKSGNVVTATWSEVTPYYLFYMFESLKDDTVDYVNGGTNYTISEDYSQYVYASGYLSNKGIEGMTGSTNTQGDAWPTTVVGTQRQTDIKNTVGTTNSKYKVEMLYYTRASNLVYVDLNDAELVAGREARATLSNTTVSYGGAYAYTPEASGTSTSYVINNKVKYGERIVYFKPMTPTRPDCTFAGWYAEPECKTPFDFSGTMPLQTVRMYAKWVVDPVIVSFYLDEAGADRYTQRNDVSKGGTVTGVTQPSASRSYGQFIEWYYYPYPDIYPTYTETFVLGETNVNADTRIYAKWKTDGFVVTYDYNDGTGDTLADTYTYKLNEPTSLIDLAQREYADHVFVGWKVAERAIIYQPYEHYPVYHDAVFVAQWISTDDAVKIVYHLNTGETGEEETTVIRYCLPSKNATPIANPFAPQGLSFTGWSYDAQGANAIGGALTTSGKAPGSVVDVYAQWTRNSETLTIIKQWQDGGDAAGRPQALTLKVNGTAITDLPEKSGNTWTYTTLVDPAPSYTITEEIPAGYAGRYIQDGGVVRSDSTFTLKNKLTSPGLSVAKSASKTSGIAVGDVITYTVTVTNTGDVALSGIKVQDSLAGKVTLTNGSSWNVATLAPTQTATITYTYTVTQSDIDAGGVSNTASASCPDPRDPDDGSKDLTDTSEEIRSEVTQAPSFTIAKQVSKTSGIAVDDVLEYTVTVTNTGNVTLSDIAVQDALADKVTLTNNSSWNVATLAPTQTATITYTYTVTQSDLDAGGVSNTASASCPDPRDPDDGSKDLSDTSEEIRSEVTQAPGLSIAKQVSKTSGLAVDDVLNYTVTVTNTGNVTLSDIAVQDTLADKVTLTNNSSWNVATLAPSKTATISYTYTVTQSDIDAGGVSNTASASCPDPRDPGDDSKDLSDTSEEIRSEVTQAPSFTVVKQVSKTDNIAVDDVLNYTVTVTNTGNVTLSDIAVQDTLADKVTLTNNSSWNVATLAPTQTATITYTYTVTQSDIDAGGVSNTASASCPDPRDPGDDSKDLTDASEEIRSEVTQAPSFTVVKQVSKTDNIAVDDVLTYTITVTNTGNLTLSDIAVQDTLADEVTLTNNSSWNVATLAPAQTATITYTYTVTQSDLDAGGVSNTASASCPDPRDPDDDSKDLTDASEEIRSEVTQVPSFTIAKQVNKTSGIAVDDVLEYTVTVTNTGNVTLLEIAVQDTLADEVTLTNGSSWSVAILAPAQTATITYTYTVTQSDIDAGGVSNTASASCPDPRDPGDDSKDLSDASEEIRSEVTQAPSFTVAKQVSKTSGIAVDDVLNYTVTVTNTGNVTLSDIAVQDTLAGKVILTNGSSWNIATLAPAQTATITYTYTVTQSDIDAGGVSNTASASCPDPRDPDDDSKDLTDASEEIRSEATQAPSFTVVKQVSKTSGIAVDDVLTYTVIVTNTGNITLSEIAVQDTLADEVTLTNGSGWSVATLAPAQTATITYTYTVTQSDIDAGGVSNTASASCPDPRDPDDDSKDLTDASEEIRSEVTQVPSFTIVKQVSKTSGIAVDDVLTYTVAVTNTGNLTLSDIAVQDTLADKVTLTNNSSWNVPTLAPAQTATITYTYTVTQSDLDAGGVSNTASASCPDPRDPGDDSKDLTDASEEIRSEVTQAPGFTVAKQVSKTSGIAVDDVLTYTVTVTNTGNVTLSEIAVQDTLADKVTLTNNSSWNVATLAPTQTATITYTYTVTQSDIDAGGVSNIASASCPDPRDPDDDSKDLTDASEEIRSEATQAPSFTVVKQVSKTSGIAVDDVLTYTVTVTNTGNLTLADIEVEDTLADKVTLTNNSSWNVATLAPAQTATITYTYTVTQSDLDSGGVSNTASASCPDPRDPDDDFKDLTDASEEIRSEVTQAPGFSIAKQVSKTSGLAVDDVLDYTVTVTNTGNVTLSDIEVEDTLADKVTLTNNSSWNVATLAPAQTATITYTYTVTQSDIDAGGVSNTASASCPDPRDPDDDSKDLSDTSEEIRSEVTQAPGLSIAKQVDKTSGLAVDDVLTYTVAVTNTGNLTLSDIAVQDTLADKVTLTNNSSWNVATLAPAQTATITYTYTVTQSDIDAGGVSNTASASCPDPRDPDDGSKDLSDASEEIRSEVTQAPSFTIAKQVSKTDNIAVDDVLNYTVTVTNTGNVTLSDIAVQDTLADKVTLTNNSAWNVATLAPAQTATITYTYTVTQSDIDAGGVSNTASASCPDPRNPDDDSKDLTDASEEIRSEVTQVPGFSVTKQVDKTSGIAVGDVLNYTVTVTNTGNVTLSDIAVQDTLADKVTLTKGSSWNIPTLAPAKTAKITYTYTVTQSGIDAGGVSNIASASCPDPRDPGDRAKDLTESSDEVFSRAALEPGLGIRKEVSKASGIVVGDVLTYIVTVTNTGNLTLAGIALQDSLAAKVTLTNGSSWNIATLAPAQTATITYTYTVTQSDIDAGGVSNVASASCPDPRFPGDPSKKREAKAAPVVSTASPNPRMTLAKTADKTGGLALGESILFTLEVRNTGNVTLRDVAVSDSLSDRVTLTGGSGWTVKTLAPGEVKIITYTVAVTQADIDAGILRNAATVQAQGTGNVHPKTQSVQVELTTLSTPGLSVSARILGDTERYAIGEEAPCQVTVTNTGNATLLGVVITDENRPGWSMTLPTLAPGETRMLDTLYTVTADDAQGGFTILTFHAGGTTEGGLPVSGSNSVRLPTGARLTIWYWNGRVGGSIAAQAYSRILPAGEQIRVDSPVLEGWTPDQASISGILWGNAMYNVVYHPNARESHTLTIRYWYDQAGGRSAAATFVKAYGNGEAYSVQSPSVPGWQPDVARISGALTENLTLDVVYTARAGYTLTVRYVYGDGGTAAPATRLEGLMPGETYAVDSPQLEGYVAGKTQITGAMGDCDREYTVLYLPVGEGESPEIVDLMEETVSLGRGNVTMNRGDCFE